MILKFNLSNEQFVVLGLGTLQKSRDILGKK
jgi:hypothetical protein